MRCRWFEVCPLRLLEKQGKIDLHWRNDYCKGDFKDCRRFKMEDKGEPHKDNMMPDGSFIKLD